LWLLAGDAWASISGGRVLQAEWDELLVTLRQSVLNRGEIGLSWSFGQAEYGRDDLEVFERHRSRGRKWLHSQPLKSYSTSH
jgi:hypothetical protein